MLLKRLAQVHRSSLELIEYQLPYKKAWASAFFVDPDTTTVEQSYESHMGTQYCNLRTRPDLLVEQTCLDLEQFYQSRQDLERYPFRTMV